MNFTTTGPTPTQMQVAFAEAERARQAQLKTTSAMSGMERVWTFIRDKRQATRAEVNAHFKGAIPVTSVSYYLSHMKQAGMLLVIKSDNPVKAFGTVVRKEVSVYSVPAKDRMLPFEYRPMPKKGTPLTDKVTATKESRGAPAPVAAPPAPRLLFKELS